MDEIYFAIACLKKKEIKECILDCFEFITDMKPCFIIDFELKKMEKEKKKGNCKLCMLDQTHLASN